MIRAFSDDNADPDAGEHSTPLRQERNDLRGLGDQLLRKHDQIRPIAGREPFLNPADDLKRHGELMAGRAFERRRQRSEDAMRRTAAVHADLGGPCR